MAHLTVVATTASAKIATQSAVRSSLKNAISFQALFTSALDPALPHHLEATVLMAAMSWMVLISARIPQHLTTASARATKIPVEANILRAAD